MPVSRRSLFGFAPAIFAATQTSVQAQEQDAKSANRTAGLTRESFEKLVNSSFTVHSANGPRSYLVLTGTKDLTRRPAVDHVTMAVPPPRRRSSTPQTDSFALTFYGAGASISQNTYAV